MAVETDAQSHKRVLAGKQTEGDPLKELSGLAEGLEPSPATKEDLDDYEELEVGNLDFLDTHQLRQRLSENASKVRSRVQQVSQINTPKRIMRRDKLAFVLGTFGSMLSAYWLGKSPATFYRLYTGAAFLLFATRLFVYKSKGWHYYLLDYCYVVHATLLVHLWVFPHSAFLHKIVFAYASGPLAWSILAFRNSLVFHSLDKITSLFLHWFPACVAWTERWHPEIHASHASGKTPEAIKEWDTATVAQLILFPCLPYLLWAILYYIKVFIVSSKKIQERNYETLFRWLTQSNKINIIGRVVLSVPPMWQPLAYMCVHIALTTMTFALCKLWWASYMAHTTFLLFIFAISAWNGMLFRSRRQNAEKPAVGSGNDSYIDGTSAEIQSPTVGASYYFDYFSKHYFEGVNKRS